MLHSEFGAPRSIFDVREKLREMGPAARRPFGKVDAPISLILVCPVTLCESERSFSALRIVKSRLRSCMGQVLLNSLLMCAVHEARLDELDEDRIASEWVKFNESCARVVDNM